PFTNVYQKGRAVDPRERTRRILRFRNLDCGPDHSRHGSNRMLAFLKGDPDATASPQALRALAAWYREFAERTQNPAIWEARVRTAEELEMNAQALESRALRSPDRAIG